MLQTERKRRIQETERKTQSDGFMRHNKTTKSKCLMGLQTLNNSEMLTAASVDEQLKCHTCSAGANGGPGEPAPTRKIGHLGRRCGQGFS